MLDLTKFAAKNDLREFLNSPFNEGDFSYATDGCICIRVPKQDGNPDVTERMVGKIDKLHSSQSANRTDASPAATSSRIGRLFHMRGKWRGLRRLRTLQRRHAIAHGG